MRSENVCLRWRQSAILCSKNPCRVCKKGLLYGESGSLHFKDLPSASLFQACGTVGACSQLIVVESPAVSGSPPAIQSKDPACVMT